MELTRRDSIRRSYRRKRLTQKILIILLGVFLAGLIFSFILFIWYARDLPAPGKLSQVVSSSTIFYDRDGKVLFETDKDKNRVPVALTDIADNLKKATISIEDKNFYKHGGISQVGIIRAFFSIIFRGHVEGGSTITQQLIKNVLLGPEQSVTRKIKEAILAVLVEKKYTKDQILEMYLNEAPYGGSFWGVGSAAKGYFNQSPKNLSLVQSAILAGLPQRPNNYSPFIGGKDAWKGRTTDVLRRMREDGYITRDQELMSLKELETIKFTAPNISIDAPHFVFYVRDQIEKEFGPKILDQGIRVKTTLSLDTQRTTEKIVSEEVKNLKSAKVGNGAAVVLNSQTGEILAMVGSYDFNNPDFGKFNAATGFRQPGSAMKPITYALGLEKGYTAATPIMDLKTEFPDQGGKTYVPENYDGKFRGPVQTRFTLGNSINVPAVKMLAMVGIRDFLQKADSMGLHTLSPTQENLNRFGLSITLGGGEVRLVDLTSAYSVFARGGTQIDPQSIIEITDETGKVLYKPHPAQEKRVFSPEAAFIISHILSDNVARTMEFGANSYLNVPGKTVAVKTGTTNDKRDNWTFGYTNDLTVGVWVGNNDNTPMNPQIASGITGASPIWYDIMTQLLRRYKDGIMDKPARVKALIVDAYLGGLPKDGYPTRSEYFIEGSEPKDVSPFYKKLKISKANGKLANEVEVKTGNYDEKEFIVISENDPVSTDGKNRWQEAIDQWRNSQADDKYKYPTETSDASADSIVVSIKSPGDHSQMSTNDVTVNAKITSVDPIKNIKIYANGTEKKSLDGDNKEINETIHLDDGTYDLKVVATNNKDKQGQAGVSIGVNKPWNSVTPTTTPITPTTSSLTPIPIH